jgi:hypothetical protein
MSDSHDEDSPKGQEIPSVIDSHIDNSAQEDMPASQYSKKLIDEQKSSLPNSPTKPGITGQKGSNHTVPQPFALATKRRVSGEGTHTPVAHPISNGDKLSDKSSTSSASMTKKIPSVTPRKPGPDAHKPSARLHNDRRAPHTLGSSLLDRGFGTPLCSALRRAAQMTNARRPPSGAP